jgi:hypothetical protein
MRTIKDTTIEEILETVAPPREGTTGAQLVGLGKDRFMLVIQGPEAGKLTQALLAFLQALHDKAAGDG